MIALVRALKAHMVQTAAFVGCLLVALGACAQSASAQNVGVPGMHGSAGTGNTSTGIGRSPGASSNNVFGQTNGTIYPAEPPTVTTPRGVLLWRRAHDLHPWRFPRFHKRPPFRTSTFHKAHRGQRVSRPHGSGHMRRP
jgi:hypothetical protein